MKAPDALDRILAGEPVDAPEDVRELAALASLLQAAWQGEPAPGAVTKGKTAALEAFADAPVAAPVVARVRPSRPRRVFTRVALAAALVGVGLPGVAWAASESALPGEVMYPVKRAFEEVQLALAGNPADEAAVLLEIAEERLQEAAIAESRSLEEVAQDALAGFRDALARFDDSFQAALALGLSVEGLGERAIELSTHYQQILEAISEASPNPVVGEDQTQDADPTKAKARAKGKGKANGHGKGKPGKRKGAGAPQPQPQPPRGTTPAGGGGGRDRDRDRDRGEARDDQQDEAPVAEEPEAEGHDDPGEGQGLGHVKGKGKGHEKHDD